MKEKIREHFDEIFADAPKTRKALDLKQEMVQNAMDKYDDMVADGHSKEDAYQNILGSIGDVSELFPEVEEKNLLTLPEKDRKKRAMLKAVSIGLYIFAGAVFFLFQSFGGIDAVTGLGGMHRDELGFAFALMICAIATVMIVYTENMYPVYKEKGDLNMVESYKKAKYINNRETALKKSVSGVIWTLALVIYFIVSFTTFMWHVTWIIFLIAVCVQAIVGLLFNLRAQDRVDVPSVYREENRE